MAKEGKNAKKEDIAGQKEGGELLGEIIQGLSLDFMCPDITEGKPICTLAYLYQETSCSRRNLNKN